MKLLERRRSLMLSKVAQKNEYFFSNAKAWRLSGQKDGINGKACQGGCVVGDKWYSLTIEEDHSAQYLYCYDMLLKTWTLLGTYTTLYHANSLTYNPTLNEFYVATGYAEYGYAVLDGSDHTQKSNVIARKLDGTSFSPWRVAYDRKRNLTYCNVGDTLYINSVDGTCIAEKTLNGYVAHTTGQGIETDGDYIYICWSDYIDVYTIAGNFVKSVAFPANSGGSYTELEEIGYDWNGYFYCHIYNGTYGYKINVSALLLKTINGYAKISYVPWNYGAKRETNAVVSYPTLDGVRIKSNGAASYNMWAAGTGFPFGYEFLQNKKCRVSFDLTRVSGSGGYMSSNIFTTNYNNAPALSQRLWWKNNSNGSVLPVGDTMNVTYEFTWGEGDYIPDSGKEGSYIGYALWLYASSGVEFIVSNYKFEAYLL